jgi:hypothetical protein
MRLMAPGALAVISILWSVPLANAAVKGCAVVQKTPDAHLFLHKAPANSEIVTRKSHETFCLSTRPDARRAAVFQFVTKGICADGRT